MSDESQSGGGAREVTEVRVRLCIQIEFRFYPISTGHSSRIPNQSPDVESVADIFHSSWLLSANNNVGGTVESLLAVLEEFPTL